MTRQKTTEAAEEAANEDDKAVNQERLTQLQDQHALELSTAKGQIRKLESAVFEAEKANSTSQLKGQSHALTPSFAPITDIPLTMLRSLSAVHELQTEMETLRSSLAQSARTLSLPTSGNSSSVVSPSRASSTNPFDHLSSRPVDADLPASSRHARKVSLSMLKARMDTGPGGGPRKVSTGAMSALTVDEEEEGGAHRADPVALSATKTGAPPISNARPSGPRMVTHQFSDRDGIIWCPCCVGDLIVI